MTRSQPLGGAVPALVRAPAAGGVAESLDAGLLLARVLEDASDAIIAVDREQNILLFNRAAEEVFGHQRAEVMSKPLVMLLPVRFRPHHPDYVRRFGNERIERRSMSERGELLGLRRSGEEFPIEVTIARLTVSDQAVFTATIRDISERVAAQEERHRIQVRYEALMEHAADAIILLGPDRGVLFTSPAYTRMFGREGVNGGQIGVLAPIHDDDAAVFERTFQDVMGGTRNSATQELRLGHLDGEWRWVSATFTNLLEEPSVHAVVINARDINDRKEAEEALRHQALFDHLTGLPNRTLLADRLTQALMMTDRMHVGVGVLFLDVDRFKLVNDSLGHLAGDALLVELGKRIERLRRKGDTVARLGGDEFVVVCPAVASETEVVAIADRILAAFQEPVMIEGSELVVSVSIGITVSLNADADLGTEFRADTGGGTEAGSSADRLIANADVAMYEAKRQGGARWALFGKELRTRAVKRMTAERELREALKCEGQIQVYYQPMIALPSLAIAAREALVRWHHPQRGLLLPGEFIEMAEETGLIHPLGQAVLAIACRDTVARAISGAQESVAGAQECVAVNVSARQLEGSSLVEIVRATLEATGLAPQRLAVEVTETALMADIDHAAAVLHDLRHLGVQLVIDDFGVGNASLRYLHRLPFDTLKIDREFITPLALPGADRTIVTTIIAMAHNLGLTVVAEGVEEHAQSAVLTDLGCDFAQGYLFGRPVPVCAAEL